MRKSLRKKDNIWCNSELASLRKEARRAWRKTIKTKQEELDILSPGSQQTENHAIRSDLVDNPFMRPDDAEMIANICSFERMEAAIYKS